MHLLWGFGSPTMHSFLQQKRWKRKLFVFAMKPFLLHFIVLLAANWYNITYIQCIERLDRFISTAWASTDWVDFASCALKLLLKMQSLQSVNVISQECLWGLFDKIHQDKWLVEWGLKKKIAENHVVRDEGYYFIFNGGKYLIGLHFILLATF